MTQIEMTPVPPVGTGGGLVVVFDSPSEYTYRKGKLTWWKEEARYLIKALGKYGLGELPVAYTYAVPIPLPPGKRPDPLTIEEYRGKLFEVLKAWNPQKILAIGWVATAALSGNPLKAIQQDRGRAWYTRVGDRDIYTVNTLPLYLIDDETDGLHYFDFILRDLQKLDSRDQVESAPLIDQVIVQDLPELMKELSKLSKASVVSCDLETTGTNPLDDTILAIGFGALYRGSSPPKVRTVIVPRELVYAFGVKAYLWEVMNAPKSPRFVFHNAKFDLQFLDKYFGRSVLDLPIEDTIMMNYMVDTRPVNSNPSPHGLKTLSRYYYDAPDYAWDFKTFYKALQVLDEATARGEVMGVEDEYLDLMGEFYYYLSQDLYYTIRLYFDLLEEIREESPRLWNAYRQLVLPVTQTLAEIELQGALIDIPHLKLAEQEVLHLLDSLIHEMADLVAQNCPLPRTPNNEDCEDWVTPYRNEVRESILKINWNSSKQVLEFFEKYLGWKLKSTSKDTLKIESRKHHGTWQARACEIIIKYREQAKANSTFIQGLMNLVRSDGRVHTEFNPNGTVTGRLSSSDPNLQNQPVLMGPIIRRAFITAPGAAFASFDYSQMELRVAGWLSQDQVMYEVYRTGRDIHKEVAAAAYKKPYDQVTKDERYAAKYIDFGVIYGRGATSLAESPELVEYSWTEEEAQEFIDNFLGQFTGLHEWIKGQYAQVRNYLFVETPVGRRRRWPAFRNANDRNSAERQAVNSPVQGTASDFTVLALINIHRFLKPYKSRIIITVHDEIDVELYLDEARELIPKIMEIMRTSIPVSNFDMPLGVDCDLGENWGDLDEEGWEHFLSTHGVP